MGYLLILPCITEAEGAGNLLDSVSYLLDSEVYNL